MMIQSLLMKEDKNIWIKKISLQNLENRQPNKYMISNSTRMTSKSTSNR